MVRSHQRDSGQKAQNPVLWTVNQVSSAAFPEQAELAIKRSGGTFCEHPGKGGMDLEETEVVTAHFKMVLSLVEKCDSGGETVSEDTCGNQKWLLVKEIQII
ncbi:hypothetical protein HGM15179_013524, partial [Zosterops borbonicus]